MTRAGSYTLIDPPVATGVAAYERALDDAVGRLQADGVAAVYQIGGVSAPGISDLDMVVVFDDTTRADAQTVPALRADHPYLFIHNLYGATRTHFAQAQRFSFFHNYRLLWGDDVRNGTAGGAGEEVARLKRQIALEYLVKLYVSMSLQRAYSVLKVRSFLLHAKAVSYDLDFLDVESGPLHDLAQQFIAWRGAWFDQPPTPGAFADAFDRLFDALVAFLREQLASGPFYLPGEAPYRVAKNLWLHPGVALGVRREGVRPPAVLHRLGNRYVKLANRLNRFDITVPVATAPPSVLAERFRLVHEMAHHNRQYLPGFDALTSSL
ncbi:MAG: hypothetical protein R3181_11495 [Rubricoccaceae bacterium]|nr:hypothetical protein [Rubricoccaceae bacterium]